MTSKERVEAALNHREPDRTPIFEYVLLSPVAEYFLGRGYEDYAGDWDSWVRRARAIGWEAAVRQYALDRVELAVVLGHDMLYVCPNPAPPVESVTSVGAPLPPDDPVERVRRRTREGIEHLSGPKDDCLLVYLLIREEMSRRGIDLPILAPAYSHGVWTDVDLMQTMVLDIDVAREHFALATRRSLLWVDAFIRLGVDQIGVGGDFAGNKLLISPTHYKELIVPEVRAVADKVHEAGLYAVNASDGNLWPVIDDFLIGCGVDAYLEIDSHAGMDLRRLKSEYGDRTTFYGNMDCGNTLSFGSEDEVRRETISCIEAGWGSGGHIFCASNAITSSVPIGNYLAMVGAYRDYFGVPSV